MRTTGDNATEERAPPEADELARDLPGLPFETKHLRADERGVLVKKRLFRREQLLPWSEIVGHRWRPLETVLEKQRGDECEVHLVSAWSSRATRRVIDTAWREYVLRKIKKDGCLRGTHQSSPSRSESLVAILYGIALILAALVLVPAVRTLWIGRFNIFPVAIAALLGLVAGIVTLLAGIRDRKLIREALLSWYRWRITADAITYRLAGEQETLALSGAATIGSGCVRVGTAAVPTKYLTYSRVMEPLTFALLNRTGAKLSSWDWCGPDEALTALFLWFVVALEFCVSATAWAEPRPPNLWLAAALPAATYLPLGAAAYMWSTVRMRRTVARGRAMLDRLGW